MSDWLVSLEGTAAGHDLALMLALGAAVLHAIFGALQKGRADPWLSRAAIDVTALGETFEAARDLARHARQDRDAEQAARG